MQLSLLETAIKYANAGWYVFPTRERPSKPFVTKTGKTKILPAKAPYYKGGFYLATLDIKQITEWWTKHPNAGIGISCGPSNLVVVDIDVKDGRKGFDNFMSLQISDEGALHSATPSGGTHIIYTGNMNSWANVEAGVDLRSSGAYFVAPPSWIVNEIGEDKGYYVALDDWDRVPVQTPISLEEKLDKLRGHHKQSSKSKYTCNEPLEKTITRVKDALEKIPLIYCDEYFSWVSIGLALKTLGNDGFVLWDNWSKKSHKYDYEACASRWDSFEPNEIGLGTIFFLAKSGDKNGK